MKNYECFISVHFEIIDTIRDLYKTIVANLSEQNFGTSHIKMENYNNTLKKITSLTQEIENLNLEIDLNALENQF
jgi:hypothetical protein